VGIHIYAYIYVYIYLISIQSGDTRVLSGESDEHKKQQVIRVWGQSIQTLIKSEPKCWPHGTKKRSAT